MKFMKYKVSALWLLVYAVLFVFLQIFSRFHFYFIEQSQLFQFTWDYVLGGLFHVGGLSIVLSEFLVQFFILPYVGAAVTAGLLLGIGISVRKIILKISPQTTTFFLFILPLILTLFMHFDFNYLFAGTISLNIILFIFSQCLGISNERLRVGLEILLTPVLYILVGPCAVLFALLVSIYEIYRNKNFWVLLSPVLAFLCGFFSVYLGIVGEYRLAFLPDAYYYLNTTAPRMVIYFSWISLPIILLIALITKSKKPITNKKLLICWYILQLALIFIISWWGILKYGDHKKTKLKEVDYYTRTEQWDKTIDAHKGPSRNFLVQSHLNLALAQKGELANQMFRFDQNGPYGLMVEWNQGEHIMTLLSDIFFLVGDIALSQQMAFESYLSTRGVGSPTMLKRLVQTNLIYGHYPVAEKYINILESTFHYRTWATDHRRFLCADSEVELDLLLGGKRKFLQTKNYLTSAEDYPEGCLYALADVNPSNTTAVEYLGALYLLSKEIGTFKNIIETCYGIDGLSILPKSFQEAVLMSPEADADYLKKFNFSPSVLERFDEYKQLVFSKQYSEQTIENIARKSYGDTYWFYYMYK